MSGVTVTTASSEETARLGGRLARMLKPGDIVCLNGDLGAGKTTLVKGMAQALRIRPQAVTSPTFVLLNIYEGRVPLYHFDFYRLEDTAQIAAIGYEEFFYGEGLAVIEWAVRLGDLMPPERLDVTFTHAGEDRRRIHVAPVGKRYQEKLSALRMPA